MRVALALMLILAQSPSAFAETWITRCAHLISGHGWRPEVAEHTAGDHLTGSVANKIDEIAKDLARTVREAGTPVVSKSSNGQIGIRDLVPQPNNAAVLRFKRLLNIRSKTSPSLTRFVPETFVQGQKYSGLILAWDRDLQKRVSIKISAAPSRQERHRRKREFERAKFLEAAYGELSPVPHAIEFFCKKRACYQVLEAIEGPRALSFWRNRYAGLETPHAQLKVDLGDLYKMGRMMKRLQQIKFLFPTLHGDNVILSARGPLLIDAEGLVGWDPKTGHILEGPREGLKGYVSPELQSYLDRNYFGYKKVGAKSDVYSFAKVASQMIILYSDFLTQHSWADDIALVDELEDFNRDVLALAKSANIEDRPTLEELLTKMRELYQVIDIPLTN